MALKPLTVDFHEPGFAATLAGENAQPFWFQLDQQQQAGYQWGPLNPQALNRYSYVQNRPVNATDPSGHRPYVEDPRYERLGRGWYARVDRFNNREGFEVHVFRPNGEEAGVVSGRDGWISKHGHSGTLPEGIPREVVNNVNGLNVRELRRRGIIPPKGRANIRGGKYLNKGETIFSFVGIIGMLISGTLEDYDRYSRAQQNGLTYNQQLEQDIKDMGNPKYLDTPFGPMPNPYYEDGGIA